MNQDSRTGAPQQRAILLLLGLILFLAAASVSCSVGQLIAGRSGGSAPTVTKTPRPTFTPIPGLLAPQPTPESGIRGALPPGVTVAPPSAPEPEVAGFAESAGVTSLILVATDTPAPTSTAAPTDTPGPTPTPTPDIETNRPTRAAGPRALPTPYVVIDSETLNARRGPGTTFERVGQVSQGDELMILGRTPDSTWWHVCCVANQPVWVFAGLVTARGPLDEVAVLTPAPTPRPTPVPPPTTTPPPTPTRLPPFDIARGPEFPIQRDNGVMTIWVKVYQGRSPEKPLGGYILKVFRDGVDVSLPNTSFGDRPFDSTYPEGNLLYNMKFEMYRAGEADWQIYLANAGGFRVSPITKFTTKGDSYRNLVIYIAYLLAR